MRSAPHSSSARSARACCVGRLSPHPRRSKASAARPSLAKHRPSVSAVMIAVIAVVTVPIVARERGRVRDDLVRDVVTVLLRVEDAPLALERTRLLGAEDASRRWIAVRNVDSGDLVIAVVLETRGPLKAGIDRGRRITALGQDPDRLLRRVGVVGADV